MTKMPICQFCKQPMPRTFVNAKGQTIPYAAYDEFCSTECCKLAHGIVPDDTTEARLRKRAASLVGRTA